VLETTVDVVSNQANRIEALPSRIIDLPVFVALSAWPIPLEERA
jgi:hypothetical protein